MQPAAFVSGGNVGKAVGGFEGEFFEQFHDGALVCKGRVATEGLASLSADKAQRG
ncbi:hypothetical protein D3C81_2234170 [compost metagenome]